MVSDCVSRWGRGEGSVDQGENSTIDYADKPRSEGDCFANMTRLGSCCDERI